jgi:GTPase SAR1 family protein
MINYTGQVRGYYNVGKSTFCLKVSHLNEPEIESMDESFQINEPSFDPFIRRANITEIYNTMIKMNDKRLEMFSKNPASLELMMEHFDANDPPFINLRMVDTSAFDKCNTSLPTFYQRGLDFIILMFSCDSESSLNFILKVLEDMEGKETYRNIPKYVVCSKVDLFLNKNKENYRIKLGNLKDKVEEHIDNGIFIKDNYYTSSVNFTNSIEYIKKLKTVIQMNETICNKIYYISAIEKMGMNELIFTILDDALRRTLSTNYDLYNEFNHEKAESCIFINEPSSRRSRNECNSMEHFIKNRNGLMKRKNLENGSYPPNENSISFFNHHSTPKHGSQNKAIVLNSHRDDRGDEDGGDCCF